LSRHPEAAAAVFERITQEQWDTIVYDWLARGRDDQLPPMATPKGEPWHTCQTAPNI